MFAPLRGRRRKPKPKPDKHCLTPGCGRVLADRWKWLCDGCFGQLPFDRKREICGARAERAPHRVFGLSRDAGEWLAAQRIKRVGE